MIYSEVPELFLHCSENGIRFAGFAESSPRTLGMMQYLRISAKGDLGRIDDIRAFLMCLTSLRVLVMYVDNMDLLYGDQN